MNTTTQSDWARRLREIQTILHRTPLEHLQTIKSFTVGTDGTTTATGSVYGYDGTSVSFQRFDPITAKRNQWYEYDNIHVTVGPSAAITFERTVPDNVLLTKFPTAAVTAVTVAPYEVRTDDMDSHWR
jgi:hypothetical protein